MRTLEVRNELDQLIGYHEVVGLDVDDISIQADITVGLGDRKIINTSSEKLLVAREAERVAERVARNISGLHSLVCENITISHCGCGVTILPSDQTFRDGTYWMNLKTFIQAKKRYRLASPLSGVRIIERTHQVCRLAVSHGT